MLWTELSETRRKTCMHMKIANTVIHFASIGVHNAVVAVQIDMEHHQKTDPVTKIGLEYHQ